MGNEITPQFNAALAEKVIGDYADGEGLTRNECLNSQIPEESCELLQDVLEWGEVLEKLAKSDPCWPCQGVAERALEKLGKKTYENGF